VGILHQYRLWSDCGVWDLVGAEGEKAHISRSRLDSVGLGLLVIFVAAFQIMLDKGRELDWFSSDIIIVCAIVAAIALISLIIWELTAEQPVLDLSVFKSRNWVVSTVTLCLMFGIFFGNIVLTPSGYSNGWDTRQPGPGMRRAPWGSRPS
jgi:DHA2 family multidrug resistance protein